MLAAALQAAIVDCLVDRTAQRASRSSARAMPAARRWSWRAASPRTARLRARLAALAARAGLAFVAPPPWLCTDNGAMIAWAGIERLRLGLTDGLDFAPRPRWPLDPAAAPAIGAGVKA